MGDRNKILINNNLFITRHDEDLFSTGRGFVLLEEGLLKTSVLEGWEDGVVGKILCTVA